MTLQCDDCKHVWEVPKTDEKGDDYNGDDLYNCPNCKSKNFGTA